MQDQPFISPPYLKSDLAFTLVGICTKIDFNLIRLVFRLREQDMRRVGELRIEQLFDLDRKSVV